MFWFILIGVTIGPLIIFGVIVDKKGKNRRNDNIDKQENPNRYRSKSALQTRRS